MKTKFLKFLAFSFLAVGLTMTSCKDDIDINAGIDDDKDETVYEKGYISMALRFNTASSAKAAKATGPDYGDLEAATTEESKVNKALIVLYDPVYDLVNVTELDPANTKVAYQFTFGASGTNSGDYAAETKLLYVTAAREVERKPYKLAVFVNYNDDIFDATKVGVALSAVQTKGSVSITDLIEGSTAGTYDNFLMSNFAGLVDVEEANVKDTKNAAENSPIAMYVERAVAKVLVDESATLSSAVGTVSALTWDVDVTNQYTYWMRKQTKMLVDDGKPASDAQKDEETEISPLYRVFMYAEDPNFSKTSLAYYNWETAKTAAPWTPDPNLDNKFLTDQYNYKTLTTGLDLTFANRAMGAITYVTENTMRAEEQWEDVTTSVLVKAVITPTKTAFSTTNSEKSYFVYRNRVFSAAELEKIRKDDDLDGNGLKWADYEQVAINADLLGFQAFLQDAKTREAITGSETGLYNNAITASKEYGNLKYYYQGVNYYNIPIRHFSDELQSTSMAYGRYGVVRNNLYKLTINKIDNFGDIKIPRKDERDDKFSYLSVQFQILPWIIRSQEIDL